MVSIGKEKKVIQATEELRGYIGFASTSFEAVDATASISRW